MVKEHLTTEQLERYCQRQMSPAERLSLYDHIAACSGCQQRLSQSALLDQQFNSLRKDLREVTAHKPLHLSYEQREAYVDEETSQAETEIIESHIAICPQCAAEVRSLREFAAAMRSDAESEVVESKSPNSGGWLSFLWLRPVWPSSGLQAAGLAALIALVILGGIIWLRRGGSDNQAQVPQQRKSVETATENSHQDAGLQASANENPQRSAGSGHEANTSQILLVLKDGGKEVALDRQGNLAGFEALTASSQQVIKAALTTQQIKRPPELAALAGRSIKLLEESVAGVPFALVSPVGAVALDERPTLRWHPLAGASSYRVSVLDADFNPVAESEQLSATEWRVSRPLKRGAVYTWQVTAYKEGEEVKSPVPPAPVARFKVLEQRRHDELEQARVASGNSHLAMGVLYAREGLTDEAEREFRGLVKANPQSRVAKRLLASVQSWRSR